MTERQWKGYLRQARKSLYCTRAEQKVFEVRIRNAVRDLAGEQPGITFEQCVEILGTPEEAAREYLKGFPAQYVAGHIRWQALYQRLLLGGLIVLLAATVCCGLYIRFFLPHPSADAAPGPQSSWSVPADGAAGGAENGAGANGGNNADSANSGTERPAG